MNDFDPDMLANYESALNLYFEGQYKKARELFARYPDDAPSAIMGVRCLSLIAGTTKLENGIFTMTEK